MNSPCAKMANTYKSGSPVVPVYLQTLKEYMYQNDKEIEELSHRSSILIAIQKKLAAEMDEMISKDFAECFEKDQAGKGKQQLMEEDKPVVSTKDGESS